MQRVITYNSTFLSLIIFNNLINSFLCVYCLSPCLSPLPCFLLEPHFSPLNDRVSSTSKAINFTCFPILDNN